MKTIDAAGEPRVYRPTTLRDALEIRRDTHALPFSGGTDLMVQRRRYGGVVPRFDEAVVFLDAVAELRSVTVDADVDAGGATVRIGASCPMADVLADERVPEVLRRALKLLAAPGLRNRATLGGNIGNASPAADTLLTGVADPLVQRPWGPR